MTDMDAKIERYYALKPTEFPVLDRLELYQTVPPSQSPSDLSLQMTLRADNNSDRERFCLSFTGVTNLRLIPWSSFVQFPLLTIRSIGDRHWENLHYEVEDAEEHSLSFFCKDFEATMKEVEL